VISPLDTDVAIETPEHIVFRYRVAGPARRALAYLIDMIVCYTVVLVVAVVVALAAMGAGGLVEKLDRSLSATMGAGIGLILLLLFAAQWVYFAVWESLRGTSLGKMALGLRVVTTTGRPIGFGGAAVRNVLRGADALPVAYVVGLCSMLLTSRFQRLGDIVAGTMVVLVDRARAAAPLRLSPPAAPAEMAMLPDEVVLDPEERGALELFLRRRGTLGRAREEELAEMVLDPLAKKHHLSLPRNPDPARVLALLYDRAMNAGRSEAPPSSRHGGRLSWR
jgi:uncharacterized RDD family membrane protein YckC